MEGSLSWRHVPWESWLYLRQTNLVKGNSILDDKDLGIHLLTRILPLATELPFSIDCWIIENSIRKDLKCVASVSSFSFSMKLTFHKCMLMPLIYCSVSHPCSSRRCWPFVYPNSASTFVHVSRQWLNLCIFARDFLTR